MRHLSRYSSIASRIALLAGLLGLAACGGTSSQSAPHGALDGPAVPAVAASPQTVPDSLPSPREMIVARGKVRSASYIYEDVVRTGIEFDAALPNNQVSPGASILDFNATGLRATLADYAFAVYRFKVPDYSGNLTVRSYFLANPAPGQAYIGVADWTKDRWNWFAWESAAQDLGPSAPYKLSGIPAEDGTILVVVLTTTGIAKLQAIALGAQIPPFASFTANPNPIQANDPLTLDASASKDLDNQIALYEWDWDNDGTYDFSDTQNTTTHAYPAEGNFTIALRVTDTTAQTDIFTSDITVTPGAANQPPTADISADVQTGDATLSVNFDGALSSDSDGTIAKYEWDFDGDATYDQDTGTTSNVSHNYPLPGIYNATLRVTDNDGDTDTDQVTITVTDPQVGLPPVANISTAKWWEKTGVDMNFSAATSSDPDGSITKYEWDWEGDGTFEEDSGLTATAIHAYATIGLRQAAVRVTDNDNNTATASITVYVYTGGPYDEVEDNDTFDTGNSISVFPVEYFDGNVGTGGYNGDDEDWYKLVVTEASGLQIDMRFEDDDCDVDMRLYDTDGTTELGASTGTDDDESIIELLPGAGTYYLKVYKFGGTTADYFLNICIATGSAVADLSANVTSGAAPLSVHLEAFQGNAGECGSSAGTIRWDLDNDGDFETDTRVANQRAIDVVFYRPAYSYTVLVEVTDFASVITTDTITITTSGTAEEVEPNDTYQTAQNVVLPIASFDGDAGDLSGNASLEDWYGLGAMTTGGTVTLHMDLFDPLCDIDMYLYASDGTQVSGGGSTGTDDSEDINFTLTADGTYYLKVYVYSGNSLKSGGYRLSGSYVGP